MTTDDPSDARELFTDEQLRYAAYSRCPCGAGLAYPHTPTLRQMRAWQSDSVFTMWDHWDCADILTGRAIPSGQTGSKIHTGKLPFSFWEVKSEDQPSANGATTRPTLSQKI